MLEKKSKKRLPILFILFCIIPSVILTVTFVFIPTIRAVLLSVQKASILSMKGTFIGFENFAYLPKDKYFIQALKNTLQIIVIIPVVTIATSFVLAFTIQQSNLKEKNLYIIVYFLPNVISATVLAIVWSYIFHPTTGVLNQFLDLLNLGSLKRTWLGDRSTALMCIAATIYITSFGYYMILHMAGMDNISPAIYESATLDGAGYWTKFFRVTLPLMKNIIGITFVMCMAGVLGASYVYSTLMTDGGPNGASNVLLKYVYTQGIKNGQVGYSSAITVVTLIISVILSVISRKLTRNADD